MIPKGTAHMRFPNSLSNYHYMKPRNCTSGYSEG